MNTSRPDATTIRAAIALAVRAPSVHNTQPWRWRVGDSTIHLFVDPERRVPETDPDGRDQMLSCGAALHHMRVALGALGWQATVHRFPNPANPTHLAAIEVHRHQPTEQDIELAAAIPRRRTDRRYYSSWPVPTSSLTRITACAAHEGTLLTRTESFDYLSQASAESARVHAANDDYRSEIALWTGRNGSLDGVPASNIASSHATDLLPARHFAHATLTQPVGARSDRDGSVILVLSTPSDDPMSRLRAGEATSAVMLTATVLGMATCPITEPLEVRDTRDFLRLTVLEDSGYPQLLLRVGWAPLNADPLPATPRRHIREVLSGLDG
ncbi:Acg family FMN-binding oxidoreductase [Smaragdicoccus niigatensis]|uniref:Acg family FMN-binding oxidoreductase n=1 Tax=Smaragdicoccus niigatensis TaxID=359359 RepID=UPI0003A45697|nr:nitroreductase family protein [Smaragdicoccus niigatensis]